jgi:PadR family transcriptional regulator
VIWRKKENETPDACLPSLSHKEALILDMLLSSARELYGLEMVDASNGELKRGTIYVTLQRMKEKGFIDSRQEARPAPEIGIARRLYSPTGHGQRVLACYKATRSVLTFEPAGAE